MGEKPRAAGLGVSSVHTWMFRAATVTDLFATRVFKPLNRKHKKTARRRFGHHRQQKHTGAKIVQRRCMFPRVRGKEGFDLLRGSMIPREVSPSSLGDPIPSLSPSRSCFLGSPACSTQARYDTQRARETDAQFEGTDRVRVEEPGHRTEFRLDKLHHHQVGKSEEVPAL